MPTLRLPLAEPLTNRDSSATKDSKLTNCFPQVVGGQEAVFKRPGTLKQAQLSIAISQGIFSYNNVLFGITNDVLTSGPGNTLVADGVTWVDSGVPTGNPPPTSFTSSNELAYCYGPDGLYFLYGAFKAGTTTLFLYKTTDGIFWTKTQCSVDFSNANGLTDTSNMIYWAGYFWLFGGLDAVTITNPSLNTVYRSVDGVTWIRVTAAAPWAGRSDCMALIDNNIVYIMGGYDRTGGYYSDVWRMDSNTGLAWTQMTAAAGWAGRTRAVSGTYNGLMWVIGGIGVSTYTDVWYSSNGTAWTQATASAGFNSLTSAATLCSYNNKMWLIDSNGAGGYRVLSSASGITWQNILNATPMIPLQVSGNINTIPINANGTMWIIASTGHTWYAPNTIPSGTSYTLSPGTPSLYFDFSLAQSAAGQNGFFFKSTKDAYFFNNATLTKVTSANYPATTVPGVVYLDGTYYVGTPNGQIFGSAIEDPLTWSALNYISAETEPDTLIAIAKSLNYLVAFGQWSTEFFYDAGNATGSPLASVPNAFFTIGCASGRSVVKTENAVVWMSQTYQRGRQIMVLNGFQPQVISTPEIDRILNADDLANVYSFSIKTNGSIFYVLTLKTSNQTLVYDFSTKQWHFWSTMTAQTAKSVTSLTYANGVVTVSQTAHGYADGDLITIAGATPSGYNGDKNITYIDSNTYSYLSASVLSSPATGTITATGYTEEYFNGTGYTYTSTDGDMIQGELDGAIYKMSPVYYNDNGTYINTKIRTVRFDGSNAKRKFNSKVELIADKVGATAYIRYTDDDYQTYSKYRPIDMSAKRSIALRLGHTRRRAYELRITDSQPVRLGALEVDIEQGTS